MAKKAAAAILVFPTIHRARLNADGSVAKGRQISQAEAETLRKAGDDVVVCGPDLKSNRTWQRQSSRKPTGSGFVIRRIQAPDQIPPCRIISPIRGHRRDIRSMKRRISRRSKPEMRFFTPHLYRRFNSANDEVALRAHQEWELAIHSYRRHIDKLFRSTPADFPARELTRLHLHDAKLVDEREVFERLLNAGVNESSSVSIAVVSVLQGDKLTSLIYALAGRVQVAASPKSWPFSRKHPHWLYDEVDNRPNEAAGYLHRILLSDGRVIQVPFTSVIIHTVAFPHTTLNGRNGRRSGKNSLATTSARL
jgi:hypothetical protein